jgi:hypothetical protein
MLEYAVVNFCTVNFKIQSNQIEETIQNIRANLSKIKQKFIIQ